MLRVLEHVWIACTSTVPVSPNVDIYIVQPVWETFSVLLPFFFFVGLAVFFVLFFKFCVYQTTSAAVSESIQFFNILSFFPFFCLFDLPIRPSAGIPKTQSPSSTISSLKRPLAFMSLPAAPTMLGTLTMRRTRISSGPPPQLHPCHQACTLRPHRTR